MKRSAIVCLTAIFIFLSVTARAETSSPPQWITEEEAVLPAKETKIDNLEKEQSFNPYPTASNKEPTGPIINIEKPDENGLYQELIDILVRFEKHPLGEPINMDSLKIVYLKLFDIDITDRVRPYIAGNLINANKIQFPKGNHRFEISIQDIGKMESSKIFSVQVK